MSFIVDDMMKMKSGGKNDERYTRESDVAILVRYLKPHSKILCPFDKEWSSFVKVLMVAGHEVTFSHIDDGRDFFSYTKKEVERFDYIISNPPYSLKNEVLEHLEILEKPFAMILGAVGIFESQRRFQILRKLDIELLIPNKRMKFNNPWGDKAENPPFSSWYICHNVLPNKIEYVEI